MDADAKPVGSGESSFSNTHWDKLVKQTGGEKDLLDKLEVTKDNRKKAKK